MGATTIVTPATNVLIVDDDFQVRQSVAEILELEGYTVTPTSTGEAALAALRLQAVPSVAIVDLWLPGMGSTAFVHRMREQMAFRIPLIIMTAWPSSHRLDLDADMVLRKPAEPTAIVRAVDRLAARRGPRRAPRPFARRSRIRATP
jgi:CheY-like chemotaxis protein